jgi:hypothetical protein
MANVKKEKGSGLGGMISGIIIVLCFCRMVNLDFHYG